jgi:TRAP-type C4-dicarboxylate transport system substrate-binding protein
MAGKKISTMGKDPTEWMKTLNCAPVPLPPGDWYMSLTRGLVDGIYLHFAGIDGFKLADVFKYHTILGENGSQATFCGYLISLRTWNKLPKDLQDVLLEAYDWAADGTVEAMGHEGERGIKACKENGNEFIKPNPDEMQQWVDSVKFLNENWIKDAEAKGLPGKEAFDQMMSLFEKYR